MLIVADERDGLQMMTPFMKNYSCVPFSLCDVKFNSMILSNVANNDPMMVESILRVLTV